MKIKTHKNFNFCSTDLSVDKNLLQVVNSRCSWRCCCEDAAVTSKHQQFMALFVQHK